MTENDPADRPASSFIHEAFFYASDDAFLEGTVPFVEDGLRAGEAVLVAVRDPKIALLTGALAPDDADRVSFLDMVDLGRNPGRIIPAWRDFVAGTASPRRGIGEPIWPGRSRDETDECHRHEALLNVAFRAVDDLTLLCPYDTAALDADIVRDATATHPFITQGGTPHRSEAFGSRWDGARALAGHLGPPPPGSDRRAIDMESLHEVRRLTGARAAEAGLDPARVGELQLAVSEMCANSLMYARHPGTLTVWADAAAVTCEVHDDGRIRDPLVGRCRPGTDALAGRGLYLVHQVCDLVQIRSDASGTTIRVNMRTG